MLVTTCLVKSFSLIRYGLHFADVAEIQEAVNDELKKVQKQKFSTAYFEFKKKSMCLRLKKISPINFGPHCVY